MVFLVSVAYTLSCGFLSALVVGEALFSPTPITASKLGLSLRMVRFLSALALLAIITSGIYASIAARRRGLAQSKTAPASQEALGRERKPTVLELHSQRIRQPRPRFAERFPADMEWNTGPGGMDWNTGPIEPPTRECTAIDFGSEDEPRQPARSETDLHDYVTYTVY